MTCSRCNAEGLTVADFYQRTVYKKRLDADVAVLGSQCKRCVCNYAKGQRDARRGGPPTRLRPVWSTWRRGPS